MNPEPSIPKHAAHVPSPILRDTVRPEDVEHVRQIVASTGFFHSAEIDIAVELVQEHLTRGQASGYLFLFADDPTGMPLGYTCYGPIACTAGSFDLYWIAVHRAAQSRGLGTLLLRETEQRIARTAGRLIWVETSSRPLYHPTRAFYLHHCYTIAAALPDFYASGDDKVVLVKPAPANLDSSDCDTLKAR